MCESVSWHSHTYKHVCTHCHTHSTHIQVYTYRAGMHAPTLTPTHTTQHAHACTHTHIFSLSRTFNFICQFWTVMMLWWKEQFLMTRSSNKEVSGRECGPSLWLPGLCALQLVNSSTDLGTRGCCSGMVDLHDLLSLSFSCLLSWHPNTWKVKKECYLLGQNTCEFSG